MQHLARIIERLYSKPRVRAIRAVNFYNMYINRHILPQKGDDTLESNKSEPCAVRDMALEALGAICGDPENKPADRIAAAKLLLEYGGGGDGSELRVIMDVPKDYLV